MNWSATPDIAAFTFLAVAFFSVLKKSVRPGQSRWLVGWGLIVLHFVFVFLSQISGQYGILASRASMTTLIWAGLFFIWDAIPHRLHPSGKLFHISLMTSTFLFYFVPILRSVPLWLLDLVNLSFFVFPLIVTLIYFRKLLNSTRLTNLTFLGFLSASLVYLNHVSGTSWLYSISPVPLAIFFICAMQFTRAYFKSSTGSVVTLAGMYLWSMVFVVAPYCYVNYPKVAIESEVWNLPKFVVAVGMLLLLLEEQVEHNRQLALYDSLTSLPNRRLFDDRLTRAIERARRSSTQTALLMIDLNNFKTINDTYGHSIGDEVLKSISRIFEGRLRRIDTIARTGGDEFAVILECPIARNEAEIVRRALLQELNHPLEIGTLKIRAGVSLGIALYPDDALEPDALYHVADARMYKEKKSGLTRT